MASWPSYKPTYFLKMVLPRSNGTCSKTSIILIMLFPLLIPPSNTTPPSRNQEIISMHKLRMNMWHMLGRIICTNNMGVSCIFSSVPTPQIVRLNIIMMSTIPWTKPTLGSLPIKPLECSWFSSTFKLNLCLPRYLAKGQPLC